MRKINKLQLRDIAVGATFLGSAGGGTLRPALEMIERYLPDKGRIRIVSVKEAAQHRRRVTAVNSGYGNPFEAVDTTELAGVFASFEQFSELYRERYGKKVGFAIPLETGVQSTSVPTPLLGFVLDLPVVDGDGAGRAIPELSASTYTRLSPVPAVLSNLEATQSATLSRVETTVEADELASAVISAQSFSNLAGLTIWPMNAKTLKRTVPIRGTLRLAERVGYALRLAPDPVAALLDVLRASGRYARAFFRGEIVRVKEEGETVVREGTAQTINFGLVTVRDKAGHEVVLINQSQNLIAWDTATDRPLAMAPDSICYVTPTGETFTNSESREFLLGKEVILVAVSSYPALRRDRVVFAAWKATLRRVGYAGRNVPIQAIYGKP